MNCDCYTCTESDKKRERLISDQRTAIGIQSAEIARLQQTLAERDEQNKHLQARAEAEWKKSGESFRRFCVQTQRVQELESELWNRTDAKATLELVRSALRTPAGANVLEHASRLGEREDRPQQNQEVFELRSTIAYIRQYLKTPEGFSVISQAEEVRKRADGAKEALDVVRRIREALNTPSGEDVVQHAERIRSALVNIRFQARCTE